MKNFTKAFICSFILCVLFSMFTFSCTAENLCEKVIRFHIPANSNSETDQNIKIKVKDEVFLFVTEMLKDSENIEESKNIIKFNIDKIKNKADSVLQRENASYRAEVKLHEDYFKTRNYSNFTLPAGNYTSLKITLGEGEGENWWCAVYPSICIPASSDFDCFTENEQKIIFNDNEVKFSFLIYEWILNIKNFFNL